MLVGLFFSALFGLLVGLKVGIRMVRRLERELKTTRIALHESETKAANLNNQILAVEDVIEDFYAHNHEVS